MKVKQVQMQTAVPFRGQLVLTITYKDGELTYNEDTAIITAVPFKTSTLAKKLLIPATNVVFFEELDEAVLEAKTKEELLKASEPPPPKKAPVNDTIVFTKAQK